MFEWHKKEAPFFTGISRGAGGFGFGKAAGGGAVPFFATGGTLSLSRSGYQVHTFTPSTPTTFVWQANGSVPGVEYLVIGGGGAGGDYFGPFPGYNSAAGGGGAGGMRSGTLTLPSSGSFSISVGPGGQSSVTSFPQSPTVFAQPGTATSANFPTGTITSEGGGRGGAGNAGGDTGGQEPKSYAAGNGGSGGGAVRDLFTTAGTGNRVAGTTTPVPAQGNPGGNFAAPERPGGGGGGAGGTGGNNPGTGGAGSTSSITGTSLTYAGGGGGGAGYSTQVAGTGGSGGGGAGGPGPAPTPASNGNPASPTAPGANYGAGGGGSGHAGSISYNMAPGGDANPGVVIIAIPTAYF